MDELAGVRGGAEERGESAGALQPFARECERRRVRPEHGGLIQNAPFRVSWYNSKSTARAEFFVLVNSRRKSIRYLISKLTDFWGESTFEKSLDLQCNLK